MGTSAVEFILNQTQMTTIVCSGFYVNKLVQMKADGMAQHITALVSLDEVENDVLTKAEDCNITVHTFAAVMQAGESAASSAPAFEESTVDGGKRASERNSQSVEDRRNSCRIAHILVRNGCIAGGG